MIFSSQTICMKIVKHKIQTSKLCYVVMLKANFKTFFIVKYCSKLAYNLQNLLLFLYFVNF